MAKCTIGKTASDKALDNVMASISRINAAERRGESLQAHQDLYTKKNVQNKKETTKDSSLTAFIASKPMRNKRKRVKVEINPIEQALIDRALELNVPVEFLRKNPNIRPAVQKEVDLNAINMELMNQLILDENEIIA